MTIGDPAQGSGYSEFEGGGASCVIGIGFAAWRRRSKTKRKVERVAVITAQRSYMMATFSDGWASAMALSMVGSVHVSQDLIAAVIGSHSVCICWRRDDAEEVRLPVIRTARSRDVVDVSAHRVCLSIARRVVGEVVKVAIVSLGGDVKRGVEAKDVTVVVGAEHERLVEFLGLEFEAVEVLVLELLLVTRWSLQKLEHGEGGHWQELELALIFAVVLAPCKVDLVDLGNNLGDCELVGADIREAQRQPIIVVIDVGQAGAPRLTVALKNSPRSSAIADGGGVDILKNWRVADMSVHKAKQLP
eukprot:6188585-Pleurochrysis_carterae.AAC.7